VGGGAVLATRLGKASKGDKPFEPTHYDDEPNNPS
jgi:hypothetical protein